MQTLYAATYLNRDGMRTLMTPAQGRHMFATADDAQHWINAVWSNTSRDTLLQVFGNDNTFEVRPCQCYDHGDPVGIYFDREEWYKEFLTKHNIVL